MPIFNYNWLKSCLANFNIILIFFNYSKKFKEIEFNDGRFSRDFPKFVKPLSVKFPLL